MIIIDKQALRVILSLNMDTQMQIDETIEIITKESVPESDALAILERKYKVNKKVDISEYMYLPEKL